MRIPKSVRLIVPGRFTGVNSDELVGRSSFVTTRLLALDAANKAGLPMLAYAGLPIGAFVTIYCQRTKVLPQTLMVGPWLMRVFGKRLWSKPMCVHLEARLKIVPSPELECIEIDLVRQDF